MRVKRSFPHCYRPHSARRAPQTFLTASSFPGNRTESERLRAFPLAVLLAARCTEEPRAKAAAARAGPGPSGTPRPGPKPEPFGTLPPAAQGPAGPARPRRYHFLALGAAAGLARHPARPAASPGPPSGTASQSITGFVVSVTSPPALRAALRTTRPAMQRAR